VAALVQIRAKPIEAEGEKVLRVSQAPSWQTNGHAKYVLYSFETTVPGMSRFEFVVGTGAKKTLTLRDAQHEYIFEEK
jgi:hypothetical protein